MEALLVQAGPLHVGCRLIMLLIPNHDSQSQRRTFSRPDEAVVALKRRFTTSNIEWKNLGKSCVHITKRMSNSPGMKIESIMICFSINVAFFIVIVMLSYMANIIQHLYLFPLHSFDFHSLGYQVFPFFHIKFRMRAFTSRLRQRIGSIGLSPVSP